MPTISLRVHDDDLEDIDRRAGDLGMSRTAFLLRAALGAVTADEKRFAALEERLDWVERDLRDRRW
jgi:hypothetical protein